MFPNEYYNNRSLRKLVVGFGSLFSDINIQHTMKSGNGSEDVQIKVPITYAPQEKFIRRLLEPSSISDGTRIETQLPKMSYIMSSVNPDPSRRINKLTSLQATTGSAGDCSNTGYEVTERIPVNVAFVLYLYTRHIDDTLQIVEQILPYFNPDHIISMDMNNAQTDVRIPITLVSNNINEKFDGDFGGRRVNISSLSFVAKSFIYGKVKELTKIDTFDINIDSL